SSPDKMHLQPFERFRRLLVSQRTGSDFANSLSVRNRIHLRPRLASANGRHLTPSSFSPGIEVIRPISHHPEARGRKTLCTTATGRDGFPEQQPRPGPCEAFLLSRRRPTPCAGTGCSTSRATIGLAISASVLKGYRSRLGCNPPG